MERTEQKHLANRLILLTQLSPGLGGILEEQI